MHWPAIAAPSFRLQLHGVGQFGNKQPHTLWAAARKSEALEHLQRKVDNAIRRVGQPQDAHKFMPHVTLATAAQSRQSQSDRMAHPSRALHQPRISVDGFNLYSSRLTSDGSVYTVERDFFLEAAMAKLSVEDLRTALKRLPDWKLAQRREAITRKFQFTGFDAAFAFMTRSALKAAEMNHHPEWFNVYNKVEVTLATHDAGGITNKDIELATAMDGYAALISGGLA